MKQPTPPDQFGDQFNPKMKNAKNIISTVAVIFITALNIYTIERPIPLTDPEYSNYAYSYLFSLSLSFIVLSLCYLFKGSTRLLNSALIVNAGAFSVLGGKALFHVAYKHNYYDWTFYGCYIIIACYYLAGRNKSYIFIFVKTVINKIYMKWPISRRNRDSSQK